MKYFPFLLFFLTPSLSLAEDITLQKYQERLASGKERLATLESDVKAELFTQDDVLNSTKGKIAAQCSRLSLPSSFRNELDVLLKTFSQPEILVTSEQHLSLIASRSMSTSSTSDPMENLKNLDGVIDNLSQFIAFAETITTCTETLNLALKQTVWQKHEDLARELSIKIRNGKLKGSDLKTLYRHIKNFRQETEKALKVYNNIKIDTPSKTDLAARKKLQIILKEIVDSLYIFYDQKAAILWAILQRTLPIADIPDYEIIASESFTNDTHNPIADFLKHVNVDEEFTIEMPLQSAEPILPSSASNSYLPKPLQKLLTSPKPAVTQETPNLKESLANDLAREFAPPPQWDENRERFRKEISPWLNVPFIISNLKKALAFYAASKKVYMVGSQDDANPTAVLTIPGQTGERLTQSFARKICSLAVRGTLCADLVDGNRETSQGVETEFGKFVFRRSLPSSLSHIGEHFTRYWLESLLGIPTEPLVFFTCSQVDCLRPLNTQNLTPNNFTDNFLSDSKNWKMAKNTYFVTAQRKLTGQSLRGVLNTVATGQVSLAELLDEKSLGVHFLFSLLTRNHTPLDNFELVQNGKSRRLKNVGFNPLFPIPSLTEENGQPAQHPSNILYLLPFRNTLIPPQIKEIFVSSDIYLVLAGVLSELTTLQGYYDTLIEQNNLNPTVNGEQPKKELNEARALGLLIGGRKQAIQMIINNFYALRSALAPEDITYTAVLKSVWPSEFEFHEQHLKKTQKDTDIVPMFFETIVPIILSTLEARIKGSTDPQPNDMNLEDVESYRGYADLFKAHAIKYIAQRKDLTKKKPEKSKRRSVLWTEITDLRKIVEGNNRTIETLRQAEANQKETSEIAALAGRNSNALKEIEEKMREHGNVIAEIDFINNIASTDFKKHPLENFFDNVKPLSDFKKIPGSVFQFFINYYNIARERGAFDIRIALKAYETVPVLGGSAGAASSSSSNVASNVAVALPDHLLADMVRDLAECTELSLVYPNLALAVINPFLNMASPLLIPSQNLVAEVPRPLKLHVSWSSLLFDVRSVFVAPPTNVLYFFRMRGLTPADEKRALEREQLVKFETQKTCTSRVGAQIIERALTPSQRQRHAPGFLLRQLLFGSEINPKWEMIVAAIGDLLLLPSASSLSYSDNILQDPGSIGLVLGPNRNRGIFKLNHTTGSHTLATYSEKWAPLLARPTFLPCKLRKSILSIYMPLLSLQWLKGLKEQSPTTEFEPWFMGVLIERSAKLQELLNRDLSITFRQILSTLYPELQFFIETIDNPTLNSIPTKTMEESTSNFDWMNEETSKVGTNMASLLNEWDRLHEQTADAPVSIDQAATEWLKEVVPEELEPQLLQEVLEVASKFNIDFENNRFPHWTKPTIIRGLARTAPIALVELAASLRMGFQVRLTQQVSGIVESLTISGTRGTDILRELVILYPKTQVLTLKDNNLRSLSPLLSGLRALPHLTTLRIENEPFHNPAPAVGLPKLHTLELCNTGVPSMAILEFQRLIQTLCTQSIDKLTSLKSTNTEKNAERDQKHKDMALLDQLKFLVEVVIDQHTTQETLEEVIYTIEYIARDPFFFTALTQAEGEFKPRIQNLRKLIPLLSQPYDPQISSQKLLFAYLHGLPSGTVRDAMTLTSPISFEATDLLELKIAGVCPNANFLNRLHIFTNLTHLYLSGAALTNFTDFPRMVGLLVLDVSSNHIDSLASLVTAEQHKRFPKLTTLNISKNKLTSRGSTLELLRDLIYLTDLNLADNLLTEVPSLGKNSFPNLISVDIRDNDIPAPLLEKFKNTDTRFYTPQRIVNAPQ
ncbi:MAG: hypothetical protein FJX03_00130 [Alphaproteobacteria bacterium]|nr:hypothetical protein [Alphaproteobacteria bacterium]